MIVEGEVKSVVQQEVLARVLTMIIFCINFADANGSFGAILGSTLQVPAPDAVVK